MQKHYLDIENWHLVPSNCPRDGGYVLVGEVEKHPHHVDDSRSAMFTRNTITGQLIRFDRGRRIAETNYMVYRLLSPRADKPIPASFGVTEGKHDDE